MKHLKEKLGALGSNRPLTKDELRQWNHIFMEYNEKQAIENGLRSYFPLVFAAELGELITVICEHTGRPDKTVDRYAILDELSDVWGIIHQAMEYYNITEEDLLRASTLKIVEGSQKHNIPPEDFLSMQEKDDPKEEGSPHMTRELWDAYLKSLNSE